MVLVLVPVLVLLEPEYPEPLEEVNTNSLAASIPFGCEREKRKREGGRG